MNATAPGKQLVRDGDGQGGKAARDEVAWRAGGLPWPYAWRAHANVFRKEDARWSTAAPCLV